MHTDANGLSRVSRRRFRCARRRRSRGRARGLHRERDQRGLDRRWGRQRRRRYTVVASFFTFYDFADSLAGGNGRYGRELGPDRAPRARLGAGPSIQRRITDADALVHVGPDFQPWVDRAIDALAAESTDGRRLSTPERASTSSISPTR